MSLAALALLMAGGVASSPELGKAEGRCRAGESGPSFLVSVDGIKDRKGLLKLEVYPPNDDDFLADDNELVNAGKVFRRVEEPVPAHGPVQLCVRVPGPGAYAISLLHDRDSNHKLTLLSDGFGCASNPRIHMSQPKAEQCSAQAGNGPTRIGILLNYHRGIFGFGPAKGN